MRPDSSLYLRALRSNMLDGGIDAAPEAVRPILRARMAGTFDRLIARHEVLPGLMAKFADRQTALAGALSVELDRRGLSPVEPTACPADAVATFDGLVAAQSRSLGLLAAHPRDSTDRVRLAGLIDDAITLETDVWRHYADAIADLHRPVAGKDTAPEKPFDDAAATAMLRAHLPDYPAIRACNVRAVATVSSHEAYFFEVEGHPDWPREVAMRRDRAFALTFTSLADEFAILDHVSRAGFPAPRPLLFAPREPGSGKGALIMQRMAGSVQDVPAMGSAGEGIFRQLAALLARLHREDPSDAGIPVCGGRFSIQDDAIAQIEFLEELCTSTGGVMPVTLAAAFAWLRLYAADLCDMRAIVHGDIDYRNILIQDGRISGMLDWELAREGSPAQDVGYCRAQIEEVMPLPAFLAAYRDAGGPDLPMADIRYFQILGYAQRASYCVRAYHAFADGLMDDFIVSTVGFIDLEAYFAIITGLIRDANRVNDDGLRAQG